MTPVREIFALFQQRGDSQYGGEAVTQLEHALQCAFLAEEAGASAELITASLLHDVGHLLHDLPDDAPDEGVDDRHEVSGRSFLESVFPKLVTEPIRLHVDAKRYLCAVEPQYLSLLSQPSVVSLNLQGGPMDEAETKEFEANPYAEDAVKLRRWDDEAKDPERKTPPLEHFQQYAESAAT